MKIVLKKVMGMVNFSMDFFKLEIWINIKFRCFVVLFELFSSQL
jgi:hypothetical protein